MPELTKQKIFKRISNGKYSRAIFILPPPPPLFQLYVFLGLLNFACQVVAPGRAFISRRLINATCKVTKPHHRIRVSQEMREDLKVWLSFLSDYNGITVMLDNVWTSILMRQFVCLRIAPMGEIKGSAFIFRVNGLKVVGQKNGRTMGSLLILRF